MRAYPVSAIGQSWVEVGEYQGIRCVEYYAHQVVCDRPRLRMILPDVRGSA
jgi:hypothetical protein